MPALGLAEANYDLVSECYNPASSSCTGSYSYCSSFEHLSFEPLRQRTQSPCLSYCGERELEYSRKSWCTPCNGPQEPPRNERGCEGSFRESRVECTRKQKEFSPHNKVGKYGSPPPYSDDPIERHLFELLFDSSRIIYNIDISNEDLGTGSYGRVQLATYGQTKVAVKSFHMFLRNSEKHVQKFKEECEILSRINHPNVVEFLGIHIDSITHTPYLVMELMKGGSLHELIDSVKGNFEALSFWKRLRITKDIAAAIECLHGHNLLHRDISSTNVLLTRNHVAKISDLGLARPFCSLLNNQPCTRSPGCTQYMPPEAIREYSTFTVKADVFSLGVLIIEVITGCHPRPDSSERELDGRTFERVIEFERRKNDLDLFLQQIEVAKCPDMYSFVISTIEDEPNMRPTAREVFNSLKSFASLQEDRVRPSTPVMQMAPRTSRALPDIPSQDAGRYCQPKDHGKKTAAIVCSGGIRSAMTSFSPEQEKCPQCTGLKIEHFDSNGSKGKFDKEDQCVSHYSRAASEPCKCKCQYNMESCRNQGEIVSTKSENLFDDSERVCPYDKHESDSRDSQFLDGYPLMNTNAGATTSQVVPMLQTEALQEQEVDEHNPSSNQEVTSEVYPLQETGEFTTPCITAVQETKEQEDDKEEEDDNSFVSKPTPESANQNQSRSRSELVTSQHCKHQLSLIIQTTSILEHLGVVSYYVGCFSCGKPPQSKNTYHPCTHKEFTFYRNRRSHILSPICDGVQLHVTPNLFKMLGIPKMMFPSYNVQSLTLAFKLLHRCALPLECCPEYEHESTLPEQKQSSQMPNCFASSHSVVPQGCLSASSVKSGNMLPQTFTKIFTVPDGKFSFSLSKSFADLLAHPLFLLGFLNSEGIKEVCCKKNTKQLQGALPQSLVAAFRTNTPNTYQKSPDKPEYKSTDHSCIYSHFDACQQWRIKTKNLLLMFTQSWHIKRVFIPCTTAGNNPLRLHIAASHNPELPSSFLCWPDLTSLSPVPPLSDVVHHLSQSLIAIKSENGQLLLLCKEFFYKVLSKHFLYKCILSGFKEIKEVLSVEITKQLQGTYILPQRSVTAFYTYTTNAERSPDGQDCNTSTSADRSNSCKTEALLLQCKQSQVALHIELVSISDSTEGSNPLQVQVVACDNLLPVLYWPTLNKNCLSCNTVRHLSHSLKAIGGVAIMPVPGENCDLQKHLHLCLGHWYEQFYKHKSGFVNSQETKDVTSVEITKHLQGTLPQSSVTVFCTYTHTTNKMERSPDRQECHTLTNTECSSSWLDADQQWSITFTKSKNLLLCKKSSQIKLSGSTTGSNPLQLQVVTSHIPQLQFPLFHWLDRMWSRLSPVPPMYNMLCHFSQSIYGVAIKLVSEASCEFSLNLVLYTKNLRLVYDKFFNLLLSHSKTSADVLLHLRLLSGYLPHSQAIQEPFTNSVKQFIGVLTQCISNWDKERSHALTRRGKERFCVHLRTTLSFVSGSLGRCYHQNSLALTIDLSLNPPHYYNVSSPSEHLSSQYSTSSTVVVCNGNSPIIFQSEGQSLNLSHVLSNEREYHTTSNSGLTSVVNQGLVLYHLAARYHVVKASTTHVQHSSIVLSIPMVDQISEVRHIRSLCSGYFHLVFLPGYAAPNISKSKSSQETTLHGHDIRSPIRDSLKATVKKTIFLSLLCAGKYGSVAVVPIVSSLNVGSFSTIFHQYFNSGQGDNKPLFTTHSQFLPSTTQSPHGLHHHIQNQKHSIGYDGVYVDSSGSPCSMNMHQHQSISEGGLPIVLYTSMVQPRFLVHRPDFKDIPLDGEEEESNSTYMYPPFDSGIGKEGSDDGGGGDKKEGEDHDKREKEGSDDGGKKEGEDHDKKEKEDSDDGGGGDKKEGEDHDKREKEGSDDGGKKEGEDHDKKEKEDSDDGGGGDKKEGEDHDKKEKEDSDDGSGGDKKEGEDHDKKEKEDNDDGGGGDKKEGEDHDMKEEEDTGTETQHDKEDERVRTIQSLPVGEHKHHTIRVAQATSLSPHKFWRLGDVPDSFNPAKPAIFQNLRQDKQYSKPPSLYNLSLRNKDGHFDEGFVLRHRRCYQRRKKRLRCRGKFDKTANWVFSFRQNSATQLKATENQREKVAIVARSSSQIYCKFRLTLPEVHTKCASLKNAPSTVQIYLRSLFNIKHKVSPTLVRANFESATTVLHAIVTAASLANLYAEIMLDTPISASTRRQPTFMTIELKDVNHLIAHLCLHTFSNAWVTQKLLCLQSTVNTKQSSELSPQALTTQCIDLCTGKTMASDPFFISFIELKNKYLHSSRSCFLLKVQVTKNDAQLVIRILTSSIAKAEVNVLDVLLQPPRWYKKSLVSSVQNLSLSLITYEASSDTFTFTSEFSLLIGSTSLNKGSFAIRRPKTLTVSKNPTLNLKQPTRVLSSPQSSSQSNNGSGGVEGNSTRGNDSGGEGVRGNNRGSQDPSGNASNAGGGDKGDDDEDKSNKGHQSEDDTAGEQSEDKPNESSNTQQFLTCVAVNTREAFPTALMETFGAVTDSIPLLSTLLVLENQFWVKLQLTENRFKVPCIIEAEANDGTLQVAGWSKKSCITSFALNATCFLRSLHAAGSTSSRIFSEITLLIGSERMGQCLHGPHSPGGDQITRACTAHRCIVQLCQHISQFQRRRPILCANLSLSETWHTITPCHSDRCLEYPILLCQLRAEASLQRCLVLVSIQFLKEDLKLRINYICTQLYSDRYQETPHLHVLFQAHRPHIGPTSLNKGSFAIRRPNTLTVSKTLNLKQPTRVLSSPQSSSQSNSGSGGVEGNSTRGNDSGGEGVRGNNRGSQGPSGNVSNGGGGNRGDDDEDKSNKGHQSEDDTAGEQSEDKPNKSSITPQSYTGNLTCVAVNTREAFPTALMEAFGAVTDSIPLFKVPCIIEAEANDGTLQVAGWSKKSCITCFALHATCFFRTLHATASTSSRFFSEITLLIGSERMRSHIWHGPHSPGGDQITRAYTAHRCIVQLCQHIFSQFQRRRPILCANLSLSETWHTITPCHSDRSSEYPILLCQLRAEASLQRCLVLVSIQFLKEDLKLRINYTCTQLYSDQYQVTSHHPHISPTNLNRRGLTSRREQRPTRLTLVDLSVKMSSPKSLPKSPSLNLKQPPRILSSPQSQSSSPQSNGGNSGAEGNSEGGTDSSGRGGPGSNQSGQDPPGNAGNGGRGGRDGGGGGGGNKHDDDDKERGTDDDREQSMEKLNEDSNWQYTRKTGPQPDPAHFHIVPSSTKQSFNSRRRENAQTCRVECDRIPISLAPAPQSCEGTENHNQMLTDQHIPTQGRCEITTCLPTEKLREAQGGLAGQEHIKTGSPEAESDQVQESYIVSQDAGDQSYQSSVYDGELLPQSVDSNSNSEIVIISPKVSLPTCSGKSHFVYVKPPLVSSETDPSLSHYLQWTIDTVGYVKWFWSNESGDVDSPCFEEGYNSTPQEEDGSVYGTSIQILESSEDNNQCLYSELVAGRILVPHEYTAIPLFSLPTVSRADADSSSSEDSVYFDANQSPDPPSVNRTESSASYASVQSSSHELEIDYHGWEEAEELVKDTPSQGNGAGHEIPAERPDDEQATQCADTGETNPLITSHTQFVIKPVICLLTASDIASEEESESLAPEFATFSSNAAPSSLQPDTSDCFTISPIQESPVVVSAHCITLRCYLDIALLPTSCRSMVSYISSIMILSLFITAKGLSRATAKWHPTCSSLSWR